jgi:phosphate transport system substrate-binding protein
MTPGDDASAIKEEQDVPAPCGTSWRRQMLIGSKRVTALAASALLIAACGGSGGGTTAPTTAASAPPAASSSAPAASGSPSTGGSVACESGNITAGGSTALQPLVAKASEDYTALCKDAHVDVQGGGSGTGLTQVVGGAFDIGNSDVAAEEKLKPEEASQLKDHQVARQGWVMVVNQDVTGVTNLTTQQASDIWTGKTTNWKDVGGPDEQIQLIIRPASSGTRATFKKIVLGGADEASGTALTEDSSGAVAQAVTQTPGATSVLAIPYYQQNKAGMTALQLDGVDGTVDNLQNETYKLQAFGHMYTKGEATGLAKSFLDYIMSPDVQTKTLPALFYGPVNDG